MKLSKFAATHFRCLYDGGDIDFHPMTVLIGENDSGKSATLDAISIFFTHTRSPLDADYSYAQEPPTVGPEGIVSQESEITLEAEFELDEVELPSAGAYQWAPSSTGVASILGIIGGDGGSQGGSCAPG